MGNCGSGASTTCDHTTDAGHAHAVVKLGPISCGHVILTGPDDTPGVVKTTHKLPEDDVIADILSNLPMGTQAALSASSHHMHDLICKGDKVLCNADISEVPAERRDAAMQWLLAQPSATFCQSAKLPLNHPQSPLLLSKLRALQRLVLYSAGYPLPSPAPDLHDLPLRQLSSLTRLEMELPYGAIPKGGPPVELPPQLRELAMSAPGLASALRVLDACALTSLRRLECRISDGHAPARPLEALAHMPALRELSLGRLWAVAGDWHGFTSLTSLQLDVYCRALKVPVGRLSNVRVCSTTLNTSFVLGHMSVVPCWLPSHAPNLKCSGLTCSRPACLHTLQGLSAAAAGVHLLPKRASLHLSLAMHVLSACDGLLSDWGAVANLQHLRLENVYVSTCTRWFDVSSLAALPRLASLHLGFETRGDIVPPLAGKAPQCNVVELVGLRELRVLTSLSVDACAGRHVGIALQLPLGLQSVLVACQGPVVVMVAGAHAAGASTMAGACTSPVAIATHPPLESAKAAAQWPVRHDNGRTAACASGGQGADGRDATFSGTSTCGSWRMSSIVEAEVLDDGTEDSVLSRIPVLGFLAGGPISVLDATMPVQGSSIVHHKRWTTWSSTSDRPADETLQSLVAALPLGTWAAARGQDLQALHLTLCTVPVSGSTYTLLSRQGKESAVLEAFRATWGTATLPSKKPMGI